MAIFDYANPKIIESIFSFLEFVRPWKKWLYSIFSFLSPMTRLAIPIFEHDHPKNFQSSFNLCEIVLACIKSVSSISSFLRYNLPKQFLINFWFIWTAINMQKVRLFYLFWRYGSLKNPEIWLAENILAHISGTKPFPNMGFVLEHSR